jgi:general secretion pathway protein B
MSMLLDALRKSEEQRRLGAQPDIHHQPGGGAADESGPLRQWVPSALIVVSALVMAWFGWQQFSPPPEAAPATQVAAQAPAAEPTAEPAQAPNAGPRTPVEAYTAPPESAPAPVADAPPAESRPSLKDISEFKAPPSNAPQTAAGAGETAKPAPEDAPRPVADARKDTPYQPDAMSYWELPQSVRDSLPQFRISVIVYADDPALRFVLVNGIRLKEKDELQSGVVLEEIRREGAVFRARNYRFLVKG